MSRQKSAIYKEKKLVYASGNDRITIDGLHRSTLTDSGGNEPRHSGHKLHGTRGGRQRHPPGRRNTFTGRPGESVLDESALTFRHSGNNVNLYARGYKRNRAGSPYPAG